LEDLEEEKREAERLKRLKKRSIDDVNGEKRPDKAKMARK
jgi:hypothetical protein